MNAKGTLRVGCLLFGIVASAGATGCSTTTRVAPISPAVAFSAPRSDVEQGCSLEGMPRVVATHVVPRGGVRLFSVFNSLACPTFANRPIESQWIFLGLSHRFSAAQVIR